jgi:ribosome biogenesis protein UTP30
MSPKSQKSPKALVTKSPKSTEKSPKSPVTAVSPKALIVKSPKSADNLKAGPGLDKDLVYKAVDALKKYHEKTTADKMDLLGNDLQIQVQFTLHMTPTVRSPKPIRVLIPHPLYKLADKTADFGDDAIDEADVCLIVKEESKVWVQAMIDKFPDHLGCIKKVLGLQSLRTKHAQFQQRRELLHKYNIFMADDRILPMLSKHLGKDFFKAKKLPIPISLTRKETLPFAIQKALSATFMTIPEGTCVTVR